MSDSVTGTGIRDTIRLAGMLAMFDQVQVLSDIASPMRIFVFFLKAD